VSTYTPDNWVILELHDGFLTFYKVLAGWTGGYASADAWRINSGITRMDEDEHSFYFYGASGSMYECNKKYYGLRSNNSDIFKALKEEFGNRVNLLPEETNWKSLDFGMISD